MGKSIYKTKFTPGPWVKLNGCDVFTELGAKNAEGISAPHNDGWMIADCDAGSLNIDEVEANALLVSMAPELYEKLETLLLIVGLTAFKYEGQREALQKAVDQAYSALRSASGHIE